MSNTVYDYEDVEMWWATDWQDERYGQEKRLLKYVRFSANELNLVLLYVCSLEFQRPFHNWRAPLIYY